MAKAMIIIGRLPETRTYSAPDRNSYSYRETVLAETKMADFKEKMRVKKINLDVIERSIIERAEKETGRKLSFMYLLEE